MTRKITHVIFDMDGLLLDTETLYAKGTQKALDPYGKILTWEMDQYTLGRPWRDAVKILIEHYDLPLTVDEFICETDKYFHESFPNSDLMPGADKLVRHLHSHKIPMCICTSSSKVSLEMKTRKHRELFSLFDHVVCSPDEPEVVNGKPAPDVFLVGASRFDPKPANMENVLVYEDAFNGVLAALSANMSVVLVPDQRMEEKFKSQATLCLNSLQDFLPESFSLPKY